MSCSTNTENGLKFRPLGSRFLFSLKIDFIIIHIFRLLSGGKETEGV